MGSPLDLVKEVLTAGHKFWTGEANVLNEQLNEMEKAGQQTLTKSYSLDKMFDKIQEASDLLNSIPNENNEEPQTWAEVLRLWENPEEREEAGFFAAIYKLAGDRWKENTGYQYHTFADGADLVLTNAESVLLHDTPEDRELVRISKEEYEKTQTLWTI